MSRKRSGIEYEVLKIIKKTGGQGILQSQLWKEMAATSREGSRVSLKLERAGLIERKREIHDGKWTYKLVAKKRLVTADSIMSMPCSFCLDQDKCGVGTLTSPTTCQRFSEWMDSLTHNELGEV